MKEIIKHYPAGDISIVWQPAKCIHSGVCVKLLPKVYKPREKPWVTPEHASSEELKKQINRCPSGALSFIARDETNDEVNSDSVETTIIEVTENGPLMCKGEVEVRKPDGSVERKQKVTAFCRCGASSNKPYCDGTHRKIDFKG